MSAVDRLLDRLDRPRQVKPGQWMTACPCCQSRRGRPVAVTDGGEGRALLHAFCGCDTAAVLAAIGLSINDLFDAPLVHHAEPQRVSVPARAILEALTEELAFAAVLTSDVLERRTISEDDWIRFALAAERIGAARDYV